jgi:hypothetical protein
MLIGKTLKPLKVLSFDLSLFGKISAQGFAAMQEEIPSNNR